MQDSRTVILDRDALQRKMNERATKSLWLSSHIGVSEKSLTRWINGSVKRIRSHNLRKLAGALECSEDELTATPSVEFHSTPTDKRVLASELLNDNLLYSLFLSGKLKLSIALIKSLLHEGMPNEILARFLIKLGYAFLFQRKHQLARKYLQKALTIAREKQIEELKIKVHLAFAMESLFSCRFEQCTEHLNECEPVSRSPVEDQAQYFSIQLLYCFFTGDMDACEHFIEQCLSKSDQLTNGLYRHLFQCSAWHIRGALYLLGNEVEAAVPAFVKSIEIGKASGYDRCITIAAAYSACCEVRLGYFARAETLIRESIKKTNSHDISMPSLLAIATYVHRVSGQPKLARHYGKLAVEQSKTQPLADAFSYFQLALLSEQEEDLTTFNQYMEKTLAILQQFKLDAWLDRLQRWRSHPIDNHAPR